MTKSLIAATAALALPAAWLVASPAASANEFAGMKKVYETQVTYVKVIDIGEPGTSHGDIIVRNGVIRNTKGKKVGDFTSTQIVVDFDNRQGTEDRQAFVTLNLPGGSVMIMGTITATQGAAPVGPIVYAIVGGTGKYIGAMGTQNSTPSKKVANTFNVVLHFV
jgi:hypothetical protein